MVRAALPPRQTGQNGQAPSQRDSSRRPPEPHMEAGGSTYHCHFMELKRSGSAAQAIGVERKR
jgi:hypothetical protein